MYTYALYTVFHACFPIQIYWYTCIYWSWIYCHSPLCYLSFPVPACLDHITWSCTRVPVMHAIWLLFFVLAGVANNPGFSCPDPRVWTIALLYQIRVAQRERGLAAACPDPLPSRLFSIGSRDSHLATREYFPVFHIVHPAFMLLSDIYSSDIISCLVITVYWCYYCWIVYYHYASVLWFLHVLMLSVYTLGYFWPTYIRRSNVSVPSGLGRYRFWKCQDLFLDKM